MAAPALVFHERKNHVPSFCPWQTKRPEEMQAVVVKHGGLPILDAAREPFTVDKIAPERRWAVRENGEVLEQHVFKDRYLAKWREWFRVAYNPPARMPSKDENEPVPIVAEYVRFEVNPKLPHLTQIIGSDKLGKDRRRPDVLTDANGDNPRPYDEVLLEQYDKDPSKLKEEERRYAASLRGEKTGLRAVEIAAELRLLTDLFAKGRLSPDAFAAEAAKLTGAKLIDEKPVSAPVLAVAPAVEAAPEPEKIEEVQRFNCTHCGQVFPSNQGRKFHETRWCKENPARKAN